MKFPWSPVATRHHVAHLVHGDMIDIIIANKNLAKTESVAKAALAAYWPYFAGVGMKGGWRIKTWKSDKDTNCKRKGLYSLSKIEEKQKQKHVFWQVTKWTCGNGHLGISENRQTTLSGLVRVIIVGSIRISNQPPLSFIYLKLHIINMAQTWRLDWSVFTGFRFENEFDRPEAHWNRWRISESKM